MSDHRHFGLSRRTTLDVDNTSSGSPSAYTTRAEPFLPSHGLNSRATNLPGASLPSAIYSRGAPFEGRNSLQTFIDVSALWFLTAFGLLLALSPVLVFFVLAFVLVWQR